MPDALALLDAAPALASHAAARHRFDISSAEDALALDLGALVSLLHARSLRALLLLKLNWAYEAASMQDHPCKWSFFIRRAT